MLWLGWTRGPIARTDLGAKHLQLGQTWEVAAWEGYYLGKLPLGKMTLGKSLISPKYMGSENH